MTLGSASGGQNVLNVNAGQLNVTGVGGTTVNPTGVLNVNNTHLPNDVAEHRRRQRQCH